ncbi:MAG: glycosyltransferase [Vicinamibacterales bacterium]
MESHRASNGVAPHAQEQQFNADETLTYVDTPAQRLLIRASAVTALLVYAAYLTYRALFTFNRAAPVFSALVYFAEVHGFLSLFFFFHAVWSVRGRRVVEPPDGLRVDVFITTYNEDVALLRRTVRAAVGIRYPHRTFVLDDGRRPAVRAMTEELGAVYVTRSDNRHAKAGNWNNAFRVTDGDIIATFDADHVPQPEFLDRTLGFFRDPKVALVQVPQLYHNLESVQHRVRWDRRQMYSEQDAFFGLVMPGKDNWNASFFCGTGAVLRREALEPLGGIMTDTITEDLHTSVVLHSQGWKSVYLNEMLVTGLAPSDLKAYETQRLRWAEGNMKVATFINPITAPRLSFHQRLSYVASLYHWTVGVPKFVFYMAPPWMLFTGTFPIANYDRFFLAIYLAFLGTLIGSYHVASRGKGRLLLDELYNMVSFFTLTRAVKRVLFGRGAPATFVVTDKKGALEQDLGPVLPHLSLIAFSTFAIGWSVLGLGFGVTDDYFGMGTAIFWTLFNMGMMYAILKIATRPGEKRAEQRFRANFPVEGRSADGRDLLGVTDDISEGGFALLWPEPLEVGQPLQVRIHLGPKVVPWTVTVKTALRSTSDGWYRYGVAFGALSQDERDLVNDSIYTIVVPHLFTTLTQPPLLLRIIRAVSMRVSGAARARAPRQHVHIPVRVEYAGRSTAATAIDVSTTGISVLMPWAVPAGAQMHLSMQVPGHEWAGIVSVARVQHRPSRGGFDTWTLGLRFEHAMVAEGAAPFQNQEAA